MLKLIITGIYLAIGMVRASAYMKDVIKAQEEYKTIRTKEFREKYNEDIEEDVDGLVRFEQMFGSKVFGFISYGVLTILWLPIEVLGFIKRVKGKKW